MSMDEHMMQTIKHQAERIEQLEKLIKPAEDLVKHLQIIYGAVNPLSPTDHLKERLKKALLEVKDKE